MLESDRNNILENDGIDTDSAYGSNIGALTDHLPLDQSLTLQIPSSSVSILSLVEQATEIFNQKLQNEKLKTEQLERELTLIKSILCSEQDTKAVLIGRCDVLNQRIKLSEDQSDYYKNLYDEIANKQQNPIIDLEDAVQDTQNNIVLFNNQFLIYSVISAPVISCLLHFVWGAKEKMIFYIPTKHHYYLNSVLIEHSDHDPILKYLLFDIKSAIDCYHYAFYDYSSTHLGLDIQNTLQDYDKKALFIDDCASFLQIYSNKSDKVVDIVHTINDCYKNAMFYCSALYSGLNYFAQIFSDFSTGLLITYTLLVVTEKFYYHDRPILQPVLILTSIGLAKFFAEFFIYYNKFQINEKFLECDIDTRDNLERINSIFD